jgi:hypothetical protein
MFRGAGNAFRGDLEVRSPPGVAPNASIVQATHELVKILEQKAHSSLLLILQYMHCLVDKKRPGDPAAGTVRIPKSARFKKDCRSKRQSSNAEPPREKVESSPMEKVDFR